ncbi:MAG TPA: hypothetical protein P5511_03195 [Candidatus Goldiibacteriota bacterium]|nr:hypothetical protein [Candidatus Goldiibacteriota bacterium]
MRKKTLITMALLFVSASAALAAAAEALPERAPVPVTRVSTALGGDASAAVPQVAASFVAPQKISADMSRITSILLSWENSWPKPVEYRLFRREAGKGEFIAINAEPIKVTAYTDAAVRTSTAYEYRLDAADNEGNTGSSTVLTVMTAGFVPPQKPFMFKAFQDVENVALKWSQAGRGSFEIAGYSLYRGKTSDKMEKYRFYDAKSTKADDPDVEPAIRYYYRMTSVDSEGNESEPTDIESVVPFPKPRTGLILTGTGYRNNIFDNLGFNADFVFTYFIGSIVEEYNRQSKTLKPVSVLLFTGDAKATVINEFEDWPSLGLGFTYTLLLNYDLGGSGASGAGATISESNKESMKTMYGFYAVASKKIIWENTLHAGFMAGLGQNGQTKFMSYLTPYVADAEDGAEGIRPSNYAYYLGFGRPLFGNLGIKAEVIVPVESNKNALFPNYYLINTHIENFIRFDFSYMHFPGGYSLLGYINFRFSVYPNPYK